MKKFQTMGELIAYMVGANALNELKRKRVRNRSAISGRAKHRKSRKNAQKSPKNG